MHQARMRPKKRLMVAAISEAPKLSLYEAITRGEVAAVQKASKPWPEDFRKTAARGTSTMMDRENSVKANVGAKPGKTRRRPIENEAIGFCGYVFAGRAPGRSLAGPPWAMCLRLDAASIAVPLGDRPDAPAFSAA